MKKAWVVLSGFGLLILLAQTGQGSNPKGKMIFTEQCVQCHSVSEAGIKAKNPSAGGKSEDLSKGLSGLSSRGITTFIKKGTTSKGKSHTKPFKGSDEELQALVDWLLEQKSE